MIDIKSKSTCGHSHKTQKAMHVDWRVDGSQKSGSVGVVRSIAWLPRTARQILPSQSERFRMAGCQRPSLERLPPWLALAASGGQPPGRVRAATDRCEDVVA